MEGIGLLYTCPSAFFLFGLWFLVVALWLQTKQAQLQPDKWFNWVILGGWLILFAVTFVLTCLFVPFAYSSLGSAFGAQ